MITCTGSFKLFSINWLMKNGTKNMYLKETTIKCYLKRFKVKRKKYSVLANILEIKGYTERSMSTKEC